VPEPASAGGVWASGLGAESLTLYIAENGDLRFAAPDFSFGAGAVTVSTGGQLSGSLRRVVPTAPPSAFSSLLPGVTVIGRTEEQVCMITGTVTPRQALTATFECTSASGATTTQRREFFYVATAHAGPSTLASLSGNYTLPFRPASNMLNVNTNGDVFAMFDNAWQCTANGRFTLLDARFSLYRAEWTLSACAVPGSQRFEGVTFSGFVQRTRSSGANGAVTEGALYLLMTATVQGQLSLISVVYDPT
jgi:hypothetical protein